MWYPPVKCIRPTVPASLWIGAFSTAQFTPKMMFDREPTLVFLYKLYGCQFNNADELVERIRASYRDPQKVLVPQTKEEFNAILATV